MNTFTYATSNLPSKDVLAISSLLSLFERRLSAKWLMRNHPPGQNVDVLVVDVDRPDGADGMQDSRGARVRIVVSENDRTSAKWLVIRPIRAYGPNGVVVLFNLVAEMLQAEPAEKPQPVAEALARVPSAPPAPSPAPIRSEAPRPQTVVPPAPIPIRTPTPAPLPAVAQAPVSAPTPAIAQPPAHAETPVAPPVAAVAAPASALAVVVAERPVEAIPASSEPAPLSKVVEPPAVSGETAVPPALEIRAEQVYRFVIPASARKPPAIKWRALEPVVLPELLDMRKRRPLEPAIPPPVTLPAVEAREEEPQAEAVRTPEPAPAAAAIPVVEPEPAPSIQAEPATVVAIRSEPQETAAAEPPSEAQPVSAAVADVVADVPPATAPLHAEWESTVTWEPAAEAVAAPAIPAENPQPAVLAMTESAPAILPEQTGPVVSEPVQAAAAESPLTASEMVAEDPAADWWNTSPTLEAEPVLARETAWAPGLALAVEPEPAAEAPASEFDLPLLLREIRESEKIGILEIGGLPAICVVPSRRAYYSEAPAARLEAAIAARTKAAFRPCPSEEEARRLSGTQDFRQASLDQLYWAAALLVAGPLPSAFAEGPLRLKRWPPVSSASGGGRYLRYATLLSGGATGAQQLVALTGADPKEVTLFLQACNELGLLEKGDAQKKVNTAAAADPGKASILRSMLSHLGPKL